MMETNLLQAMQLMYNMFQKQFLLAQGKKEEQKEQQKREKVEREARLELQRQQTELQKLQVKNRLNFSRSRWTMTDFNGKKSWQKRLKETRILESNNRKRDSKD